MQELSKMTEDEIRERFLSVYQGATLFIKDREEADGLPDYHEWHGPVPRAGEFVYVTKHGSGGYRRRLRVSEINWSSIVRDNPKLPNHLAIHCEIITEQVSVEFSPSY